MSNLPNWAKWLILAGAVVLLAVGALWLNDYVARVPQPAPDAGLFAASSQAQ
ncbi:MAG: hypothetical protein IJ347_01745 [Faecalibacterium sp.]|nr:hypothetical protein [Faecalibacterium sp.]